MYASSVYQPNPRMLYAYNGNRFSPPFRRCMSINPAGPDSERPIDYFETQNPDLAHRPPWYSYVNPQNRDSLFTGCEGMIWSPTRKKLWAVVKVQDGVGDTDSLISCSEFLDSDFTIINPDISSPNYGIQDLRVYTTGGTNDSNGIDRIAFLHYPKNDPGDSFLNYKNLSTGTGGGNITTFSYATNISSLSPSIRETMLSLIFYGSNPIFLVAKHTYQSNQLVAREMLIQRCRWIRSTQTYLPNRETIWTSGEVAVSYVGSGNYEDLPSKLPAQLQASSIVDVGGVTRFDAILFPMGYYDVDGARTRHVVARVNPVENQNPPPPETVMFDLPNPTYIFDPDLGTVLDYSVGAAAWTQAINPRTVFVAVHGTNTPTDDPVNHQSPDYTGLFQFNLDGTGRTRLCQRFISEVSADKYLGGTPKIAFGPGCL